MPEFDNRLWSTLARNLTPYVPGEQPQHEKLVKLNTNEHPFAPSPKVAEAIQAVLAQQSDEVLAGDILKRYPDPESLALRQVVADYHDLQPDQVFLGNGSDEVLAHVFAAFFKKDRPLLYPDITYSFYPVYCQLFGVNAVQIPLRDDFSVHPDDYRQPCDGIIFANPNAPTGLLLDLESIEKLIVEHPSATVVVDEAYIDFGGESALALIGKYDNLLVTQTTSKSRALAGLRVGMAFGHPSLIEALNRVKNSFNSYPIDRLAQAGAMASYQDDAYFQLQNQKVISLRQDLVAGLIQRGFEVLPSTANFVFATHLQKEAAELAQGLRAEGVIVRHFSQPRVSDYLRITVGRADQHARLFDVLDGF